jgi:hypothetical protein
MKVSDAIKRLQEFDNDDDIVFTCWTGDDFATVVHYDDWANVSTMIERKMDWSETTDKMVHIAEIWSDEND